MPEPPACRKRSELAEARGQPVDEVLGLEARPSSDNHSRLNQRSVLKSLKETPDVQLGGAPDRDGPRGPSLRQLLQLCPHLPGVAFLLKMRVGLPQCFRPACVIGPLNGSHDVGWQSARPNGSFYGRAAHIDDTREHIDPACWNSFRRSLPHARHIYRRLRGDKAVNTVRSGNRARDRTAFDCQTLIRPSPHSKAGAFI